MFIPAYHGYKGQKGFTLIELLAVMAIIAILAGLVAGAIVGLGSQGQSARLAGDRDSLNKAANRFFLEAFPEVYPVVSLDDTDDSLKPDTDLGVRLIDFKATLPQDPTKRFVPDFLNNIPDSSALVEWRIDTNSGEVFFVNAGALLIKPSNNVLDIEAATREPSSASDHTLTLSMAKNESALKTLKVKVPAGYSMAGRYTKTGTLLGTLSVTVASDNDVVPGNTIVLGGVLLSTEDANEFELIVDYNDNITSSGGTAVEYKTAGDAVRVHTISLVAPSGGSGGELTLVMDRGDDGEANTASETWKLTIFGEAVMELSSLVNDTEGISETARTLDKNDGFAVIGASSSASTGTTITTARIITTPSTDKVYRWLAEEHTAIAPVVGDTEFFSDVPGSLGILIKGGSTATATPAPTATSNTQPLAFNQSLSMTLSATLSIILTGFDDDGNDLTFVNLSDPSLGSLGPLTGVDLDTVLYTNTATGVDTFTFSVNDGTIDSNAGTITITITE
ncbi:MAG: prepilin-type N-terminal cleavage/methylation domain-containing protein [Chloroflexi bacterium]|nr:prepilin-type N-terminal cleavage/methylation domain-containing protein [Chloroflexota bacterium]